MKSITKKDVVLVALLVLLAWSLFGHSKKTPAKSEFGNADERTIFNYGAMCAGIEASRRGRVLLFKDTDDMCSSAWAFWRGTVDPAAPVVLNPKQLTGLLTNSFAYTGTGTNASLTGVYIWDGKSRYTNTLNRHYFEVINGQLRADTNR